MSKHRTENCAARAQRTTTRVPGRRVDGLLFHSGGARDRPGVAATASKIGSQVAAFEPARGWVKADGAAPSDALEEGTLSPICCPCRPGDVSERRPGLNPTPSGATSCWVRRLTLIRLACGDLGRVGDLVVARLFRLLGARSTRAFGARHARRRNPPAHPGRPGPTATSLERIKRAIVSADRDGRMI
jgi:hypothetical protein